MAGSFFTQTGGSTSGETGNGSFLGEVGAADVLVTNFEAILSEAQTVASSAAASAATVASTIGQANSAEAAAQSAQSAAAASASAAAVSAANAATSATTAATAAVASVWTTGDVKITLKVTPDSGWVMFDDGTIGDASSGASNRANADTSALFQLLWNNVPDTYCPVVGGRGASASADFAAHKPITLPRTLGRALAISGTGSGLSGHVLGSYVGEETHLLTVGEIPAHTHGVADPGHTHVVTDPQHNHGISDPTHNHGHGDPGHAHSVYDPGHAHGVADPTHSHGVNDPGHGHGVADPGHGHTLDYNAFANYGDAYGEQTYMYSGEPDGPPGGGYAYIGTANRGGPATGTYGAGTGIGIYGSGTGVYLSGAYTGIGIYGAGTNISIYAAGTGVYNVAAATGITTVNHATGITNQTATTGITTQNAGGGSAHNNLQPTSYFNIMVRL